MILSDREIQAAIAKGDIVITDCPPPDSPRWTSTTLDLTLDAEIRPWTEIEGDESTITPGSPGFNSNALVKKHTRAAGCSAPSGFVLQPRNRLIFVLGWTIERIALPHASKIAARVEGKSSLARIGLGVHVTAPTIHPGFGCTEGKTKPTGSPLRLEIWNIGPLNIRLTKGMPICQIIFEEVHGTPNQPYEGQFRMQGPGRSRKAGSPKSGRQT